MKIATWNVNSLRVRLPHLLDWLAAESPDEGRIHCSEPQRAALRRLFGLGLADAFRLFDQPGAAFSWWDYRMAAFRRNMGLRIDHVLLSPALAAACRGCRIDVAPRRLERPSDHAPVVCELG